MEHEIKTEVILNDKCAEVIRDITSGTYCFQCNHCGQFLQADSSDSFNCSEIFKHLDGHYFFEHQLNEHEEDECLQSQFLDIEFLNINSSRLESGGIGHILDENVVIIKEEIGETKVNEENDFSKQIEEKFEQKEKDGATDEVVQESKETIEIIWEKTLAKENNDCEFYVCNVCNRRFIRANAYLAHCKRHTSQNKEFEENKAKLNIIRELAEFSCSICDTIYTKKGNLQEHNRTHHKDLYNFDEFPEFKCEKCGRTFIQKCKLKRHVARHLRIEALTAFTCDICASRYHKKIHLVKHMRSHENCQGTVLTEPNSRIKETCRLCGKIYKTKQNLREHLRAQHPNINISAMMYKCELCNKSFFYEENLNSHLKCHDNFDDFQDPIGVASTQNKIVDRTNKPPKEICAICGTTYKHKNDLKSHHRLNHPEEYISPLLQCDFCDMGFFQKRNLILHMKTHNEFNFKDSGKTTFGCEECGKVYLSKERLGIHRRQKHSEKWPKKLFKCELCGTSFVFEKNLISHQTNHEEIKEHCCHLCAKNYINVANLREHYHRNHPGECPEHLMFECNICSLKFDQKKLLTLHMTSHNKLPKFTCEICGKQCTTRGHLNCHMIMHDPSRRNRYKCELCGKGFPLRSKYAMHIQIHNGDKPYACTYCEKRFTRHFDMLTHERSVHTGDKRHQCEICGKRFLKLSQLTKHKAKHNNESKDSNEENRKVFWCDVCQGTFSTIRNLHQHKILHTGEKPYPCRHCDMKFAQAGTRRCHEKKNHKNV